MKQFLLLSILLFIFSFSALTSVYAVDFTVTSTNDLPDLVNGDGFCLTSAGNCSIRSAIEESNALASNDRVLFSLPVSSTMTLTTLNGGELQINNNGTLEIVGMGANILILNGGTGINRIFNLLPGSNVTISGIRLTDGDLGTVPGNEGGAILAINAMLTLNSVEITNNSARLGGGLFTFDTTTRILNSTISFNDSNTSGCGGMYHNGLGTLYMSNTTVSDNTTPTPSILNGGGICIQNSNAIIRNSTITNNTSGRGGGIDFIAAGVQTLNLGNTIVAGNSATNSFPEIFLETSGGIISAGNNLIGDSGSDSTQTNFPITYLGSDLQNLPPLLGILINNGGTTPTRALTPGSPAIDAGDNAKAVDPFNGTPLTGDQRQIFTRIADGNNDSTATVDIGAYEYFSPTAASVTVSGMVFEQNGRGLQKATVLMTDQQGNLRSTKTNSFGYFQFTGLASGQTYVFSIKTKGFSFASQIITVNEDFSNLYFIEQ